MRHSRRNLIVVGYVVGKFYLETTVVETGGMLLFHFREFEVVGCNDACDGKLGNVLKKQP